MSKEAQLIPTPAGETTEGGVKISLSREDKESKINVLSSFKSDKIELSLLRDEKQFFETVVPQKSSTQFGDFLFEAGSFAPDFQARQDDAISVYRGYWQGNTVAIYLFDTDYQEYSGVDFNELEDSSPTPLIRICQKSDNLVKILRRICIFSQTVGFITEYIAKNSSLERWSHSKLPWPLDLKIRVALDIVNGLEVLHKNTIAHPELTAKNILLKILPDKPVIAKILIPYYEEKSRDLSELKDSKPFLDNIGELGKILQDIFFQTPLDAVDNVLKLKISPLVKQACDFDPNKRPNLAYIKEILTDLFLSNPYSKQTQEIEAAMWKQCEVAEHRWQFSRLISNSTSQMIRSSILFNKKIDSFLQDTPKKFTLVSASNYQKKIHTLIKEINEFLLKQKDYMGYKYSNPVILHITESELTQLESEIKSTVSVISSLKDEIMEMLEFLGEGCKLVEDKITKINSQLEEKITSGAGFFKKFEAIKKTNPDRFQLHVIERQQPEMKNVISTQSTDIIVGLRYILKLVDTDVQLPLLDLDDEKTHTKVIKLLSDRLQVGESILKILIKKIKPGIYTEIKKEIKNDKRRENFFKLRDDFLYIEEALLGMFYPYEEKSNDDNYIELNSLLCRQLFSTLNYLIEMATVKYPDWTRINRKSIEDLLEKLEVNIKAAKFAEHAGMIMQMFEKGENYIAKGLKQMNEDSYQEHSLVEYELYQGFLGIIAENLSFFAEYSMIRGNLYLQGLNEFIIKLDLNFVGITEENSIVLEAFLAHKNNLSQKKIRQSIHTQMMDNLYSDQLRRIDLKLAREGIKEELRHELLELKKSISEKQMKYCGDQKKLKNSVCELRYDLMFSQNEVILQGKYAENNLFVLQQDLTELERNINLFLNQGHRSSLKLSDIFMAINENIKEIFQDLLNKMVAKRLTSEYIEKINEMIATIRHCLEKISRLITVDTSQAFNKPSKSSLLFSKELKYDISDTAGRIEKYVQEISAIIKINFLQMPTPSVQLF